MTADNALEGTGQCATPKLDQTGSSISVCYRNENHLSIEGSAEALTLFGKLLQDHAASKDSGCRIAPLEGPGIHLSVTGTKIAIDYLDGNDVLIEGSADALALLGQLIRAHAAASGNCGFKASPWGAGEELFSDISLGIHLHRLPCTNSCCHPEGEESS